MAEATNRLQNFPNFIRKLMKTIYANQMIEELVKFDIYEDEQLIVWNEWEEQPEEKKYDFIDWLVSSIDALYRSGKYTDGYKLSVVNGTDRKAIKKEAKQSKKSENSKMVCQEEALPKSKKL